MGKDRLIDIVMPVQIGRLIPPEVLMGCLWHMGIRTNLIVSTVYPFHLAQARNAVKVYAETDYVLMLDNDVVMPPRSLEVMARFLDAFESFGAIALPKNPSCVPPLLNEETVSEPEHVDMSCVLWRRDVLLSHTFETEGDYCDCLPTCKTLRSKGHRIGFLPKLMCRHFEFTQTKGNVAQESCREGLDTLSPQEVQRVLSDYLSWWNIKGNRKGGFLCFRRFRFKRHWFKHLMGFKRGVTRL